jgi:hypothetical protein
MTPDDPNAPPPSDKPIRRRTPPATPAVQAWLDGETSREGLASADEQETAEFWSKINSEADRLRRRATPIHVQQRILSSIPDEPAGSGAPAGARSTTSSSGSITLRVSTAILAGAALVAVGAVIGAFFLMR